MASVIAMAGDDISIPENGFLMLHNPWTLAMGDAEEMRKVADVLDKLKGTIVSAYRKQVKDLSENEIKGMMDEETWMTADEALENGFVHSVDKVDDEDTAQNIDLSKFRNSSNFLSRLKAQHLKSRGSTGRRTGVVPGAGKVTLEDLREANADPTPSSDDLPVPPLPANLADLARGVARSVGMPFAPDLCILNYYEGEGRMGMHQDKDESAQSIAAGLPVVSISLGDTARFLFGGLRRKDPVESRLLESGDAFVFGGPARLRYHGVSRIVPSTAPPELDMAGRFNLTFRQY
jgi:DNA alkylation damage repair protein AlkB